MKIEKIVVRYLQENCYLVTKNNQTIIIDPGDEFDKILEFSKHKNIVGILVTHHHFDHIGALKECENYFNLKHNPEKIEGFDYQVINNPGHSKDSISFYFEKESVLFAGDFIFKDAIGRCDLSGGDFNEMKKSIKFILNYPKTIEIYPGHGPKTTLENELDYLNSIIED